MAHKLKNGVIATPDSWYRVELCDRNGVCCQGDRIGNLTIDSWHHIDNSACSHLDLGVTEADLLRQRVLVIYGGVFMLGSLIIKFENDVSVNCGNPLEEAEQKRKVLLCSKTVIYH